MGIRTLAAVATLVLVGAACAGSEASGTAGLEGDVGRSRLGSERPGGGAGAGWALDAGEGERESDVAVAAGEELLAEPAVDPSGPPGAMVPQEGPGITDTLLVDGAEIGWVTLELSVRGDSGAAVVALQERLAELGFAPGGSDGSYGRRTAAAVSAFQELVDLEPTGDVDALTVAALTDYRYDGLMLAAGDEGDDVAALQQRLAAGPFDPGAVDGRYGRATVQAVWALEKLAGVPVDGDWGPLDERAWELLVDGRIGGPAKDHDVRWVEVDLSEQLVKVYDPGSTVPTLISHASSGSGIPWANEEHSGSSITPKGEFHISRRIAGWRESSLDIGRLYNPLYFYGGIALHGATSVPLYPASHGCVRLPMHIAEYLPGELPNGTPVHVLA